MELEGIAFIVATLLLGVALLERTRRRGRARGRAFPDALDMGAYIDPIEQAEVYLKRGRPAMARQVLEEALRLAPDRDDLRERLARIG